MELLLNSESISTSVAVLRLGFSFVAGACIGFERSYKREYAGLRTHILICLGSTLLMLLSIWIPEVYLGAKNGDPGRIAAQVVSGIGFLGAGSIIRLGNTIKGLTTAASLWFVAALGLGIGAGLYFPSALALGIALFALIVLDPIERFFFPAERFKHLVIEYSGDSDLPDKAKKVIEDHNIQVTSVDTERNLKKDESVVKFFVRVPNEIDMDDLYQKLKNLGGVERVELREKF
jgi:putative Mg2+ transporter-C (MgtC) family protein